MPGTFSPPPVSSEPNMHRDTRVAHVRWCMLVSLTSGFLWTLWRGNVPDICTTFNSMYLVKGPWLQRWLYRTHFQIKLAHIKFESTYPFYNPRSLKPDDWYVLSLPCVWNIPILLISSKNSWKVLSVPSLSLLLHAKYSIFHNMGNMLCFAYLCFGYIIGS